MMKRILNIATIVLSSIFFTAYLIIPLFLRFIFFVNGKSFWKSFPLFYHDMLAQVIVYTGITLFVIGAIGFHWLNRKNKILFGIFISWILIISVYNLLFGWIGDDFGPVRLPDVTPSQL